MRRSPDARLGLWVAFGAGLGVLVGALLGGAWLPIGIGVGVGTGCAVGVWLDEQNRRDSKEK
jgi:hypothetical protein